MVLTQKEGTVEGKLCREETVNSVEGDIFMCCLTTGHSLRNASLGIFFFVWTSQDVHTQAEIAMRTT